jgi:hypothetical protein
MFVSYDQYGNFSKNFYDLEPKVYGMFEKIFKEGYHSGSVITCPPKYLQKYGAKLNYSGEYKPCPNAREDCRPSRTFVNDEDNTIDFTFEDYPRFFCWSIPKDFVDKCLILGIPY